ncbi:MAG TPA: FliI/YscN family ATPase [Conexibacter sp.]|nr:FliI/YscN family ATPase [Conexibacter sp.]
MSAEHRDLDPVGPGEVRVPHFARASALLRGSDLARRSGRVADLIGLVVEATGLQAEVGEVCLVNGDRGHPPVPAEVVGFRGQRTLLMPLGEMEGIGPGTTARATGSPFRIRVGDDLLGRVVDALGNPLDGMPAADAGRPRSTVASPPDALSRPRIEQRVDLGVRALDALVPCGRGQRLGIFAGSGVGKSSLLGMIARSTTADVNVIALVGERGREVREFVERDLGDALSRSVVVVATSDQPALVRIKAAFTATAIAEHFRDAGNDVMLMMDSVTRFAMAQREVGLAIGEPPATRGYTPSVFAQLPRLLERSGTAAAGSITALYTVLVDGDDMNEPIADAVRSILDGHVVLTRELAHASHYPAIDVLQSVSRLVGEVVSPEVRAAGQAVRRLLAAYREKEDLIAIGAYQRGTDPLVDAAIALRPAIERFLRQAVDDRTTAADADRALLDIAAAVAEHAGAHDGPVVDAEPVGAGFVPPGAAPPGSGGLATPAPSTAIPPLHLSV